MFNSVEYIRAVCKQRKIPIAKLEKECGFANGYLNPKKLNKIPYDRAVVIGEYLGISTNLILTGEEDKKAPVLTAKDERDVAKDLEQIMSNLESADGLMFDGNPMSDEARESMRAAIELGLRTVKLLNKETYTPKKYKKG